MKYYPMKVFSYTVICNTKWNNQKQFFSNIYQSYYTETFCLLLLTKMFPKLPTKTTLAKDTHDEWTAIPIPDTCICALIALCLGSTYFMFDGTFSEQIKEQLWAYHCHLWMLTWSWKHLSREHWSQQLRGQDYGWNDTFALRPHGEYK